MPTPGEATDAPESARPALPPGRPDRREILRRIAVAAVVVVAIGLFALAGVVADTESDDTVSVSGEIVERLIPSRNDEVLRQSPVGVDLTPGWGLTSLTVNGTVIPERDWQVTLPLALYQFVPGEGMSLAELDADENCVAARVHALSDPTNTRLYDWCFTVS